MADLEAQLHTLGSSSPIFITEGSYSAEELRSEGSAGEFRSLDKWLESRLSASEHKNVDHLERARLAYQASQKSISDAESFQMHLWRRFRDTVKVYFGALGVLGFSLTELVANWCVWSIGSVVGVPLAALSVVFGVWCGLVLFQIFEGDKYSTAYPTTIRDVFRTHAGFYARHATGRIAHFPRGSEVLPHLSIQEHLRGGQAPVAGLGLAIQRLAELNFIAAEDNVVVNERRSAKLRFVRHLLGLQAFFSILAWGVIVLAP